MSLGGPARTAASPGGAAELRVDRVACSGHGICASLLPRTIELDEWGYPVLAPGGGHDDPSDVEAAVRLCPARALYLMNRT
ncbi:ferredoxin [Pedococcus sp. NPDC057267]|uniref:ferredoxin n=1 Tax=Pedococcus sp. NPDC057267 TaxID=3346077 RepID=UPI00362A1D6F